TCALPISSSVPIVMVYSSDPVRRRYIATLARPGANITGLTWNPDPKIAEKYVEFLREIVPGLLRIGGLIDPGLPGVEDYRTVGEAAASRLGLTFPHVVVQKPTGLENAFVEMSRRRAQAVMVYGRVVDVFPSISDRRSCGKIPAARDLRVPRGRGRGWAHVVWGGPVASVPPSRCLRRQDPQRRQAGRSSRRAADQVRAGHQPEDREGPRIDDPALAAAAGGSGD